MQLSRGESLSDTAHVLSRYLDALAIRVLSHDELEEWAAAAEIPVINALTSVEHPCQALADALTIRAAARRPRGRPSRRGSATARTCSSRSPSMAKLTGMEVVAACPEGYEPPAGTPLAARARPARGGRRRRRARHRHLGLARPGGERERRLRDLEPYRLDESLVALASPDAVVLHCLPAHPGEEISPRRALRRPLGGLGRGGEPPARAEGAAGAAPRLANAARELVLDRGEVDAARGEQHVQVVDEVGRLRDDALVALGERGDARPRPPPRRPCARPPATPSSSSVAVYEPSGRSCARSEIVRQSAGREARERAGVAHRARRARRASAARRRRSRRGAPRPRACSPTSRPCASTPRASGSRTSPRRVSRVRPLGLVVHPGEHQHAPRVGVLDDRRAQLPSGGIAERHPQSRSSLAQRGEPLGVLVQDRGEQRRLRDLERLGDVARARRRRPRRSPAPRPRRRPRA